MRLTVLIPTTDGPRVIVSLEELESLERSQVMVGTDYLQVGEQGDFTVRYNDFVGSGGPLGKYLKLSGRRFELTLSGLPTSGRSWEMPVALAHWLLGNGHQIVAETPDIVLWSTGALGGDASIVRDEYEIAQKLESTASFLVHHGMSETLVLGLLPPGFETEPDTPKFLKEANICGVSSLREATEILANELKPKQRHTLRHESHRPPDRTHANYRTYFALATIAGLVAVGIYKSVPWHFGEPAAAPGFEQAGTVPTPMIEPSESLEASQDGGNQDVQQAEMDDLETLADETQSSASVQLIEYRAPRGSTCIRVLFYPEEAQQTVLQAENFQFPTSNLVGLCALGYRVPSDAQEVEVSLPLAISSQFIDQDPSMSRHLDDSLLFPLSPGSTQRFTLMSAPRSAQYEIHVNQGRSISYTHGLTYDEHAP